MVPRLIPRQDSFEPYAELWNACNPEMPKTPTIIEAEADHDPSGTFEENWLFEEGGAPVALVLMYDPYNTVSPRRLNGDILVQPSRESEFADVLVETAVRAAANGSASRYAVWTTSRLQVVSSKLESIGFVRNQVAPVSRLDLVDPIPPHLLEKRAAAEASGLRFASMRTLSDEGIDWVEPLWHSTWEMVQDMPLVEEPNRLPLDQYREMLKNDAIYQFELMFAALEGDRIVAYTRVQRTGASNDTVLTGLTGTVRSHRRRGLATALKSASIELLRDQGFRYLVTDNDETNPMFQLNLEFGFKRVFEFWRYQSPGSEDEA